MLVLSRGIGKKVVFRGEGDLELVVLTIIGNRVKLGFATPKGGSGKFTIHREEVVERIKREGAREA